MVAVWYRICRELPTLLDLDAVEGTVKLKDTVEHPLKGSANALYDGLPLSAATSSNQAQGTVAASPRVGGGGARRALFVPPIHSTVVLTAEDLRQPITTASHLIDSHNSKGSTTFLSSAAAAAGAACAHTPLPSAAAVDGGGGGEPPLSLLYRAANRLSLDQFLLEKDWCWFEEDTESACLHSSCSSSSSSAAAAAVGGGVEKEAHGRRRAGDVCGGWSKAAVRAALQRLHMIVVARVVIPEQETKKDDEQQQPQTTYALRLRPLYASPSAWGDFTATNSLHLKATSAAILFHPSTLRPLWTSLSKYVEKLRKSQSEDQWTALMKELYAVYSDSSSSIKGTPTTAGSEGRSQNAPSSMLQLARPMGAVRSDDDWVLLQALLHHGGVAWVRWNPAGDITVRRFTGTEALDDIRHPVIDWLGRQCTPTEFRSLRDIANSFFNETKDGEQQQQRVDERQLFVEKWLGLRRPLDKTAAEADGAAAASPAAAVPLMEPLQGNAIQSEEKAVAMGASSSSSSCEALRSIVEVLTQHPRVFELKVVPQPSSSSSLENLKVRKFSVFQEGKNKAAVGGVVKNEGPYGGASVPAAAAMRGGSGVDGNVGGGWASLLKKNPSTTGTR